MQERHTLRDQLRIVIVGHVDHGKSTLIGRLLYDTDSLPTGKLEELKAVSEKRGMALEWSFVLDAFQAERDQAVTIDTTQIWFRTQERDYVIIDAPGHREFLKNMISGAAQADAAVLVVDAAEGVQEQTRRHAYLLRLLGLEKIIVVINKIDLVDHDAARYSAVKTEVEDYLRELGVMATAILPISARHGDNIASKSKETDWFEGEILLDALARLQPNAAPTDRPLRFPVQDVYRYDDERRVLVGRVESGILRTGDTLLFSPSNREATVTSIDVWPAEESKVEAKAGESVGITLDKPIFVERGDMASHVENAPALSTVLSAHLFWLGEAPLEVGKTYNARYATQAVKVTVQSIDRVIDTETLARGGGDSVPKNAMAEVVLRAHGMLALDGYKENVRTGRLVLFDGYDVVGGGTISLDAFPDQRQAFAVKSTNITEVDHLLDSGARAWRNGHRGTVIWMTGLSGAGKSTLAMRLEKRLFQQGIQTYVLDGDNVRSGLNKDLGFSPEDRAENIRRIGEVAALMADAGLVTIASFISPFRADRHRARAAAGGNFHELYIKADVETCAARDPKGLYKRARSGEIQQFTGISSPYEAPENAQLVIDTAAKDIETCVDEILSYVRGVIALEEKQQAKAC